VSEVRPACPTPLILGVNQKRSPVSFATPAKAFMARSYLIRPRESARRRVSSLREAMKNVVQHSDEVYAARISNVNRMYSTAGWRTSARDVMQATSALHGRRKAVL
jgi:hypothetical protein